MLDVACGSGLYGPHLKAEVPIVYGIDHDPVLCDTADANGAYDRVVCDRVERSAQHFDRVDAVFCSEFLEHLPNDRSGPDGATRSRSSPRNRLVITVPNPLSPHFKHDPTHIGRYNVYSMMRTLNSGGAFIYRLLPLGFSDLYRDKVWAACPRPALEPRGAALADRALRGRPAVAGALPRLY